MTEIVEPIAELTFSAPEAKGRAHKTLPAEAASDLQLLSTIPRFIDRPENGFGLYAKLEGSPFVINFSRLTREEDFDFDKKTSRKFSFVAVKTPSFSPENQTQIEDLLKKISNLLSVQKGNKETGRKSKSASIFIIEERGQDAQKETRLDLLKNFDLSRPDVRTGDKNGPIVWVVSRKRESIHQPINAMQTRAGSRIKDDTARNRNASASRRVEVDDSVLKSDIDATRMLPGTMERAADFNGVTLRDELTGDILVRDKEGNEYESIVSSEDEREVAAAGREEQQRVDAVRRANRNVDKTTAPKPDSSIKNAIENPGRSFTSDRLKCNRKDNHNPNFPAYLYRKVESVKGTNILFNICPTHGVISKGIAPKLEK